MFFLDCGPEMPGSIPTCSLDGPTFFNLIIYNHLMEAKAFDKESFVQKNEKLSKNGETRYSFQSVTLCPIGRKLINKKLMTRDQIDWLNA